MADQPLSLYPAPIPKGKLSAWQSSGRTIGMKVSPQEKVAIWVSKKRDPLHPDQPPTSKGFYDSDRAVYFTNTQSVPHNLVPLYTEAYTLFESLQDIYHASEQDRGGNEARTRKFGGEIVVEKALPTPTQINYYHRILELYLNAIQSYLLTPELSAAEKSKWHATFQILSLTQILYVPKDGKGQTVVGEEILDWVNKGDPGPTVEEGEDILRADQPWGKENFWDYVTRSLLRGFIPSAIQLLLTLKTHPSPVLSRLSRSLCSHLEKYPRSINFQTSDSFLQAHRDWRASLRPIVNSVSKKGWTKEGKWLDDDDWLAGQELETILTIVVEILEGEPQRILEESEEWKEALGAWGLWVRPRLTRDDVPETMTTILEAIPADSSVIDDAAQVDLCRGLITKAITLCNQWDIWLVAHLTDVLDKVGVLEPDSTAFSHTLRDHFILSYADHLQTDPGLWRMTCSYLGTCGVEGVGRLGALLKRVPLRFPRGDDEMDDQTQAEGQDIEDVFKMFYDYGLEEESRSLARTIAQRMARERKYGIAVSFCVRAGDGRQLGIIANKILDEYVTKGAQEYIALVNSMPQSLFSPDSPHYISPYTNATSIADLTYMGGAQFHPTFPILASRLSFLPMYRDFHETYRTGDKAKAAEMLVKMLVNGAAPTGFLGVLLVDSVPLLEDEEILIESQDAYEILRILEEVLSASSHSPADYLTHLSNLSSVKREQKSAVAPTVEAEKTHQQEAWNAAARVLDVVRLALAKHLAKCCVADFSHGSF